MPKPMSDDLKQLANVAGQALFLIWKLTPEAKNYLEMYYTVDSEPETPIRITIQRIGGMTPAGHWDELCKLLGQAADALGDDHALTPALREMSKGSTYR